MTLNTNIHREEQYITRNHYDGNTSDDSLLLMADNGEDTTPLLHDRDNISVIREADLSSRSLTTSTHCHIPDDKFDYGARNRLIIVLIFCIIFMIIEIVGMLKLRQKKQHFYLFFHVYIGGVLSNSIAVVTDAAHMAIDATSFLISLSAMYLATKRPTRKLSFGYIRAGLYLY